MRPLTSLEMLAAMQQSELDPKIAKRLKAMMGVISSKRGVTKKPFNRAKARARNKMQRASRRANRGVNTGKRSSASYGGNGANRTSL